MIRVLTTVVEMMLLCSALSFMPFVAPWDKAVLADIYVRTGGASWLGNVSGWQYWSLPSQDPCQSQWPGVICTANPARITYGDEHRTVPFLLRVS